MDGSETEKAQPPMADSLMDGSCKQRKESKNQGHIRLMEVYLEKKPLDWRKRPLL